MSFPLFRCTTSIENILIRRQRGTLGRTGDFGVRVEQTPGSPAGDNWRCDEMLSLGFGLHLCKRGVRTPASRSCRAGKWDCRTGPHKGPPTGDSPKRGGISGRAPLSVETPLAKVCNLVTQFSFRYIVYYVNAIQTLIACCRSLGFAS